MSFFDPLVCSGISGRSSTINNSHLFGVGLKIEQGRGKDGGLLSKPVAGAELSAVRSMRVGQGNGFGHQIGDEIDRHRHIFSERLMASCDHGSSDSPATAERPADSFEERHVRLKPAFSRAFR